MIRQKQCLVHKVPSGVAILSHMCGVVAIVHPQGKMVMVYLANIGNKKFLSFISANLNGSRHLVFWSLGTLTGLRDGLRRLVA
jgi:hypothetical protein